MVAGHSLESPVRLELDFQDALVLDRVLHEPQNDEDRAALDRLRAYVSVKVALAAYDARQKAKQ